MLKLYLIIEFPQATEFDNVSFFLLMQVVSCLLKQCKTKTLLDVY